MATNQILPFAADPTANALTPAQYAALAAVQTGFQAGVAKSAEVNTVLRQSTFVAAAVAQWVANRGQNVLDDQNLGALVAAIQAAQNAMLGVNLTAGMTRTLNATTEANYPTIRLTGYINLTTYVVVPDDVGRWTFVNDTTGTAEVVVRSGSGQTTVVPRELAVNVFCDGSNVRLIESGYGVPVGTILATEAQTADPGYLLCRGDEVSRTTYAALFSRIGTTFGGGNGSTTFNLPDGRGVALRGFDAGRRLDIDRIFGSYQADMFANHDHALQGQVVVMGGGYNVNANPGVNMGPGAGAVATTGGIETRMKNLAVNFQIKY